MKEAGEDFWGSGQIHMKYFVGRIHLSYGFVFDDNHEDCIVVGFSLRPLRECSWVPGVEVNTVLGSFCSSSSIACAIPCMTCR